MKKRQMLLAVLFMLALVVAFFPADTQAKKKAKPKLNKTSATLAPGNTVQLKVENNKKKVKWSSSKTSVATVNGSGLVTAKAAGSATVTAKVGKKSYKCNVTVKNVRVTIPQRGTKADQIVKYIYKVKGSTPKKLSDFIVIDADSAAKADEALYDWYGKTGPKFEYVGPAVLDMTDSWVTYQNFDTAIEYYTGAHRYDITISGIATLPKEVTDLIKTKTDNEEVFNGLSFNVFAYKSYNPYKNREEVLSGSEDGRRYLVLDDSKTKGMTKKTTYDKSTGAFTFEVTDVRGLEKASFAEIYMSWFWFNYPPVFSE